MNELHIWLLTILIGMISFISLLIGYELGKESSNDWMNFLLGIYLFLGLISISRCLYLI